MGLGNELRVAAQRLVQRLEEMEERLAKLDADHDTTKEQVERVRQAHAAELSKIPLGFDPRQDHKRLRALENDIREHRAAVIPWHEAHVERLEKLENDVKRLQADTPYLDDRITDLNVTMTKVTGALRRDVDRMMLPGGKDVIPGRIVTPRRADDRDNCAKCGFVVPPSVRVAIDTVDAASSVNRGPVYIRWECPDGHTNEWPL